MAEIQLVQEYNPMGGVGGTCHLCNASKRTTTRPERIITTNITVDYVAEPGIWPERWFELCETCVTEMAHLLGMITEDEKNDLVLTLSDRDETIAALTDEVKQLQSEIQAFGTFQKYIKATETIETPVTTVRARR